MIPTPGFKHKTAITRLELRLKLIEKSKKTIEISKISIQVQETTKARSTRWREWRCSSSKQTLFPETILSHKFSMEEEDTM